jgi:O-antigen ligase
MKVSVVDRYLQWCVLVCVISVTLLVTPFNTLDYVNLPKLSLLVFIAFIALGLLSSKRDYLRDKSFRTPLVIVCAFIFELILVFLKDNQSVSFKLFGTPSRNTGFLAYLSLSVILLISLISARYSLLKRYVWTLVIVGIALALYGLAQSRGFDFYEFDNPYSSNVFGTFGNPNFQSAFMGMFAAVALTIAFFSKVRIQIKVMLILLFGTAITNIFLSSLQGYISFAFGFAAVTVIYFFKNNSKLTSLTLFCAMCAGGILVGLGMLDKGPLADLIYKSSVQARVYFWSSALTMMREHPFFGVGFDGYGDWYRRSRSFAVAQANPGIVADTAHNIPLDIGTSGGFPLLILYLALIGLALRAIIKVVKRNNEFDVIFAALVAAWVAYQAQSLISINQLGLGVWGWSLTGLLIGYEINSRNESPVKNQSSEGKKKSITEMLSAGTLLVTFITSSVGVAIALPPFLAANNFYRALQSGDANVIQPAAYLQPYDRSRFLYVSKILAQNNLESRAIDVLRYASRMYPDSFELWEQWSIIPSADPLDAANAKAQMKRLDPYNPNLV